MNLKKVTLAALMMGAMLPAGAQLSSLWSDFVNPPDEARTKLWWFHGETESTPYGIDADLTAFRDKGVGGVVWYDQVHYSAEGAQDSMSPEWWDLVKHAARKARELGLSFEVAVSNGYVAGGPWITPDLGMQRTDFIDTLVTVSAPGEISLVLPHPNRHKLYGFGAWQGLDRLDEHSRQTAGEAFRSRLYRLSACRTSGI